MSPAVTIVIRARNEAAFLGRLLAGIRLQDIGDTEIILVDSGSTDDTRAIAEAHACRLITIEPERFTYGRALNVGGARPYLRLRERPLRARERSMAHAVARAPA